MKRTLAIIGISIAAIIVLGVLILTVFGGT